MKRPPGDVTALYQQGTRQADGAFFHGQYLGMLVLKWKITGDDSLLPIIKKAWDANHMLVAGSGYPGLVARSFGKNKPEDPGYIYRKDGSGDQMVGWLFGTSLCCTFVDDPQRKAQAAADIKAICAHLRKHDLHIYENETTPTRYGDLKTPVFGIPIGYRAMPVMALAVLAVKLNPGDATCKNFLSWILKKNYHHQVTAVYSWAPHKGANLNVYLMSAFIAWWNDETPRRRKYYKEGVEGIWDRAYDWQMAFYALIYSYIGGTDHSGHITDSIDRLRNLTQRYNRTTTEKEYLKSHLKIVPIEDRPMTSSYWAADVVEEVTKIEGEPLDTVSYCRMDFLLAYWLGRFLKKYPADQRSR